MCLWEMSTFAAMQIYFFSRENCTHLYSFLKHLHVAVRCQVEKQYLDYIVIVVVVIIIHHFILILPVFPKYSQRYSSQVIFIAASVVDMHMTHTTDRKDSLLCPPLHSGRLRSYMAYLAYN